MHQTLPFSDSQASDRFGLTLFFAIIIHAIIILGITFSPTSLNPKQSTQPPLEITLVHQHSDDIPDQADYLAQANLSGAGNTQDKSQPSSPAAMLAAHSKNGNTSNLLNPVTADKAQPIRLELLTSNQSQYKVSSDNSTPTQQQNSHTSAELIQLNMEIAALSAEIDRSIQAYAKQIKHRFIAANARKFRDAAYLDAWRTKVEHIGNTHYPDEARRRKLSGGLVLDVAVNANGTLHNIHIRRSSGHKILDDAAIHIVKLAAPFAPFTAEMRKDTDILHIIRGWQFQNNNRLVTSVR